MTKHPYVTQQAHGDIPAGSSCLAYREAGQLVLEFEGGREVRLNGAVFALEGIEYYENCVWGRAMKDLYAQEDARFLELCAQAIASVGVK